MREIGVERRHCEPQGFIVLALCCSQAVASIGDGCVAGTEASSSSPSSSSFCEVDLFQVGFGVARGSPNENAKKMDGSAVGAIKEELSLGIHRPSGQFSTLSIRAWTENTKPEWISKIIVVVGLLLPALAQVGVLGLGSFPPPRVREQEPTMYPATSILAFTALLRLGAMANLTVILPFASVMSTSSGRGSQDSGYLIGVSTVGSMLGLWLYSFLSIQQLTCAYHSSWFTMLIGNLVRAYAGHVHSFALLILGQVIAGVEAGAMYHSGLAFAYHAKGAAVTPSVILNVAI